MTHEWLAEVAALVGAAGAVLLLIGRPLRAQLAGGFVLLAAAVIASIVPASRAARVDIIQALRSE